jgi:hypothetical protein
MTRGRPFDRLRRLQRPLVRVVQRIILQGSLFVLYLLGFGLTRAFMTVFARRTLFHRRRFGPHSDSYWISARSGGLDSGLLSRQS